MLDNNIMTANASEVVQKIPADEKGYLKFQRKNGRFGPCFQTIFPFLMTMVLRSVVLLTKNRENANQIKETKNYQ